MTLDQLQALLDAATPGEWTADAGEAFNVRGSDGGIVAQVHWLRGRHGAFGRREQEEVTANMRLIVAAHNALPALLECVRAAIAMRAQLAATTLPNEDSYDGRRLAEFDAAISALNGETK